MLQLSTTRRKARAWLPGFLGVLQTLVMQNSPQRHSSSLYGQYEDDRQGCQVTTLLSYYAVALNVGTTAFAGVNPGINHVGPLLQHVAPLLGGLGPLRHKAFTAR
ncbi:hypothetical protein H0A65_03180 [Alcaligenaceae bacterium]|nr:hypothetical protein [Alcaligenaceae bacterium]